MGNALEEATRQHFDSLAQGDAESMIRAGAKDIQGIDEISRRWMRGIDEVGAYVRQVVTLVGDVHTTISDVNETVLEDIGLVTCWIEQDYTLEGVPQHVSAPTTLVFRRESGAWRILLFHSVPLPHEEK